MCLIISVLLLFIAINLLMVGDIAMGIGVLLVAIYLIFFYDTSYITG